MVAPNTQDRRTYMGSHDTAGVVGAHPNLSPSQVYMNKVGLSEGFVPTEQMRWGLLAQPIILDEFARRMKVELEPERFFRHPSLPWFGGTPDATLVGRREGVDAKNVRYASPDEWGEPGSADVPEHIKLQAHHFMTLLDADAWHIAAWVAGCELRVYTIERDPEMSDLILEVDGAFWRDHVEPRIPPPVDGTDACRRLLLRTHPHAKAPLRLASPDEEGLLLRYAELDAASKRAEEELEAVKNAIIAAVGDARGIGGRAGKVTYTDTKGRSGFDADRLRAEHPGIAAAYEKTGQPGRKFNFTPAKEMK